MGEALLVAAKGILSCQSASADSSILYALLAAWALSLAVRQPGEQGGYSSGGLLVAPACLIWASGLYCCYLFPYHGGRYLCLRVHVLNFPTIRLRKWPENTGPVARAIFTPMMWAVLKPSLAGQGMACRAGYQPAS